MSAYLDSVATPAERGLIEDHLAGCEVCRADLEELRTLKSQLASLPQWPAPRSFALGPRALRPAALSGTVGGFARALSSVAAALAVVAVGLSLILQGLPRQTGGVAAPALETVSAPARAAASVPAPQPAQGAAPAQALAKPAADAAQGQAQATGPQAARPAASAAPAQAPAPPAPPSAAAFSTAAPSSAAPATVAAQPTRGGVNIPLLTGELALLLAAVGVGIYSLRWWRS